MARNKKPIKPHRSRKSHLKSIKMIKKNEIVLKKLSENNL